MKLASLKHGRDGTLIVVDKSLKTAVKVPEIASTLQAALDDWAVKAPQLERVYKDLGAGKVPNAFPFRAETCH
ncbi:hypothetical protein ACKI1O_50990, partial [Streptomyces scabiei]